ncbi:Uncharacterized protein Adt_04748 [Abeliophyllum distichum]|uniref:Retrotransposon gag domain-containing protein n=1 Tax=Abeliophyllum distichum TaxID=126358 RepID=A0ABD1V2E6_9LAMI
MWLTTHEKKAMDPNASHITEVVDHKKSTKQRLDVLDGQSTRLCVVVEALEEKVETAEVDIRELNIQLDESRMMCAAMTDVVALLPYLREEMEAKRLQLPMLQRVVGNGQAPAQEYAPRLKILEPRTYGWARDVKEVENFLFDMEQYFLTANIEDGASRVTKATMYLDGEAKLWWRTKYVDIQANRVQIDTWDLLKEAIRTQFFPENVEYQAQRALRELKHTGSIWDYVKTFSGHMLDIRDMSEKDKLFTFVEGLKPWARTELQRQKVDDVSTAMGAAECLMDY